MAFTYGVQRPKHDPFVNWPPEDEPEIQYITYYTEKEMTTFKRQTAAVLIVTCTVLVATAIARIVVEIMRWL